MSNKYCFVSDAAGTPLSPTREEKAWYLLRKKKAVLLSKIPKCKVYRTFSMYLVMSRCVIFYAIGVKIGVKINTESPNN